MIVAVVLWWVALLGGLIPTSWFLWRFRPAWPIRRPSLVINGLVFVAWLGYVRSLVTVIVAAGWVPTFKGVGDAVVRLGLGGIIDTVLIMLLIAFLKYRQEWLHQLDRTNGGEQ